MIGDECQPRSRNDEAPSPCWCFIRFTAYPQVYVKSELLHSLSLIRIRYFRYSLRTSREESLDAIASH